MPNFADLAQVTSIWPDPNEMFRMGSKIQCQRDIEMAAKSLNFSMPFSVVCDVVDLENIAKDIKQGKRQGVLKRDFSDQALHVIGYFTDSLVKAVKQAIDQTKKDWSPVSEAFGFPSWIFQPMVAHLMHIGEVRSFVAGSSLVMSIVTIPKTKPGNLDITLVDHILPLHKFE